MKLEELVPGIRARGLTAHPVEIVRAEWLGSDYLHVTYRDAGGSTAELLMDREMEAGLAVDRPAGSVATPDDVRGWKLGVEAMRIRYAGLIDPMLAVSSSSLRPLPHQIKAVYGELLPRTPLRYLLADDPGAGKTIMCGLYVKELMLRGDLERCLIVAPGGLVDQWVDELWDKFRLQFRVLTRDLIDTTVGVSVFDDNPRLIARMDMLSRNEELQALLEKSEWDLVVVDEAHRMSARFAGREMEATKRYGLGKLLGSVTRNLLLMTATPHSGDPAAFQAFLALLDQDRFSGKTPGSAVAGTDVMRRMLKEELLTMDGKPLFPERRASTVRYTLSQAEQALYEAVSDYVRHEMNRADLRLPPRPPAVDPPRRHRPLHQLPDQRRRYPGNRRTQGFHNYALPYSWDVRLGHKTREAAVAELEDEIDEGRVRTILREIGYGDLPPAADAQPRLVAFVAARPEIDDGAIRAGLADRLPPALVPSTIVTLDALPLLSSGKIDRRGLVARLPDSGTTVPAAAPGTEAERRVSEIVGRVLGGRAPGVRDSFFTAGGTSLLALRLTAQLVEAFGVMLPADTVFATPTIAGLAARIETELLADIDALSESDAQQLLEGGA